MVRFALTLLGAASFYLIALVSQSFSQDPTDDILNHVEYESEALVEKVDPTASQAVVSSKPSREHSSEFYYRLILGVSIWLPPKTFCANIKSAPVKTRIFRFPFIL